ncbi:hypothetical protein F5Y18DRAFT_343033 [Xylariaceae sp. FL1019]|nr:hypothetical protein F5Y18DRAFT_343033 [Xylariaceae sp. FL1019]
MLERAAASLDPCGLRIVPPSHSALRSTRRLHTAFWQHGAADLELGPAWQCLMHGTFNPGALDLPSEHSPVRSLSASAFLLDFLYPPAAVALMRPLAPASSDLDRLQTRARPSQVMPRLYSSSTARAPSHPTSPAEPEEQYTGISAEPSQRHHDSASFHVLGDKDHLKAVWSVLKTGDQGQSDLMWRHYKAMTEDARSTLLRRHVLAFLSKTDRVTDSWKISELFSNIDPLEWDNATFVVGIRAELNLQNHARALAIFEKGLQSTTVYDNKLVSALDSVLAAALSSSNPKLLEILWGFYPQIAAKLNLDVATAKLDHVASVPNLADRAFSFNQYRASLLPADLERVGKEATLALQKILVRRALFSCDDSRVVDLLLLTEDLHAFEDYLPLAQRRNKHDLVVRVYDIYRKLNGATPSRAALHVVFNAYARMEAPYSKKIAGVDLVWDDIHAFHGKPSQRAYQRYMAFHANRGNKDRVYSLWSAYVRRFRDDPNLPALQADDTFSHLLQAHAVNGESEKAQRIFDDVTNVFKLTPLIYDWNILLRAYVKANDYDGAIETFERLCMRMKPDRYTFGTLMHMAGSRGDLGYTVELYRRARSAGVKPDDAILGSVVDAYCQNDHFQDAEDVCVRATDKGVATTWMWNRLLYYHALRRDLGSLNDVLNRMAAKNMAYDQFTYQYLLLGLGLCRQPQHALQLLITGLKDNLFTVTPAHFQLVMGALIKTGEPRNLMRLHMVMREVGDPTSKETWFRLVQATTQLRMLRRYRKQAARRKWLGEALRIFYHMYDIRPEEIKQAQSKKSGSPSTTPDTNSKGLLGPSREAYHFSTMMNVYADLNEDVNVGELVGLYRYVSQGTTRGEGSLPFTILDALLLSSFRAKRYDRVQEIWDLMFQTAKTEAFSKDSRQNSPRLPKISPKYRHYLCSGLRIMQLMYFKQGNYAGLETLVKDVLDAGFQLDGQNWNLYVQLLSRTKQYKAAFGICEKVLMPNWLGWEETEDKALGQSRVLDIQRKMTSPRHIAPRKSTFIWLARAYLDLSGLGQWSSDAATTLDEINRECIQVVRAINTMKSTETRLEAQIINMPDPNHADIIDFQGSGLGDSRSSVKTGIRPESATSHD